MNNNSEPSKSITSIFFGFYSHFILRDLLAKITPGAIVLLTIFIAFFTPNDGWRIINYLTNFWTWIIFIIISWLIGFAVQGVGEFTGLIRYYPKKIDRKELVEKEWYKMRLKFLKTATETQKREEERLCVVKETCGNGCVGLIISFIFIALNVLHIGLANSILYKYIHNHNVLYFYLVLLLFFVLILSLWYMHYKNTQRQFDYVNVHN